MKTANQTNLWVFKTLILSILISVSATLQLSAQCSGVVTLSTQAQVNAFACSSFTGTLIIDDGGTGSIISIDPIFVNGLQNGNITGHLFVQNCPGLMNLQGLDGIVNITGDFRINNCPNLTNLGGVNFKLQSVGEFFLFIDLPQFNNATRLINLSSVGKALAFQQDCGLTNFAPFNTLTSCPWVEFWQTNHATINAPFAGLTSSSRIRINGCSASSFTGFTNLTSLVPNNLQSLVGDIIITNNPNLSAVNINSGLNTVGGISVSNNPNLNACCFLAPFIPGASPLSISGNGGQCSSPAVINAAPTLSACPANRTVSTALGTCLASTTAVTPTVFDNCDLDSYDFSFLLPNGNTQVIQNAPSGVSVNLNNFSLGTTVVSYIATDDNGNITSCSFNMVVEDNEAPLLSNIPSDVTLNCNDNFPTIPTPLITDNCDGSPALTVASSIMIGPCGISEIVEIQEFTWTATDVSGNTSSKNWKVTRISDFSFDLGAPINVCDASTYVIDPGNIGSTYAWSTGAGSQALSVSASGMYSLTVTTANGCCYVDDVEVNFVAPPDAMATGSVLSCGAASTQIMGNSATAGATYGWMGPGGFTSSMQNPMVSSTGDYVLTVSSPEGCTATSTAIVTADTDVPDASAMGGTIDCSTSIVQLMGNSTTAGVTYGWTGPNAFTSSMQNPMVTDAGIYTLSVTGTNSCVVTADAEVIADIMTPVINLVSATVNCITTELEYGVEGSASWVGPGGFTSTNDTVMLSMAGTYNVTVTGSNSCTSVASFDITLDTMPPDINAEGGVISCIAGQDTLAGMSTTTGVTYSWTGPGGFISNLSNPIAATLGTYTLVVTAPNGCSASQDVELIASMDAPQVAVTDGTIDCINTSVDLTATSEEEGLIYSWIGPGGFTADGPMVTAIIPGSYTVTAVNEDGCAGSASTIVIDNTQIPEVMIEAGNLNCLLGATKFTTTVSENVTTYAWTGPNDFTSSEKEPEVTIEGTYILVVTASNGCTATAMQTLTSDVENPDAVATGGMLTCTMNTIVIMGSTTTVGATFGWAGPENYSSTLQNPEISVPGNYILTVTAPNGCTAIDSTDVAGDPDLPIVSATGGTIDCTSDEVNLMGSTESTGATIKWEGPNGFASTNANPVVDIPGTYTFTATSTGNCVAFTSVEVILDKRDPDLALAEGFLNCEAGLRDFNVATNANDGIFSWIGPDGFTSAESNPSYSKAGIYMVTVTGTNGCFTSGSIEVDNDVNYESNINITGDDVMVEIVGGTPPFLITFDGSIEGPSVMDLSQGDHFVEIADGLGCEKRIEFTIMSTSVFEEEKIIDIKMYPNPVVNELVVDWNDSNIKAEKLTIINANGQLLENFQVIGKDSHSITTEGLAVGIYYLKIEGKDSLTFKKFLKM